MLPCPDKFYISVLKNALRKGFMHEKDSVLVVCGGGKDAASLREVGFSDVLVSNISDEKKSDVENLAYANESFDVVIVHSGLHHCASPHRGLLEMYRVARRCVVLFEPADCMATRFGKSLGVGQTYEFAAVAGNELCSGGWRNTAIPNWVYRFTASEIRQTICCASPFGPHRFLFLYRTRLPWGQLKLRNNKIPLFLVCLVAPFLRVMDSIGPVFSNNIAAVIRKPNLSVELFPWLEMKGDELVARRTWFEKRFQ